VTVTDRVEGRFCNLRHQGKVVDGRRRIAVERATYFIVFYVHRQGCVRTYQKECIAVVPLGRKLELYNCSAWMSCLEHLRGPPLKNLPRCRRSQRSYVIEVNNADFESHADDHRAGRVLCCSMSFRSPFLCGSVLHRELLLICPTPSVSPTQHSPAPLYF